LDFALLLTVFIIGQFTVVWVEFEGGGRSDFPPAATTAHGGARRIPHLSERFARLPFALVLVALFHSPKLLGYRVWGIFLLFVLSILAFALRFLINTLLPLAFWTEQTNAIENFWFLFTYFFRPDRAAGNVS